MASIYCAVGDLLIGNIPTPVYVDKQKYVDDAADEIDSYLGARYVTPIVLEPTLPAQRPSALMLKRINAHLASGRLILAAAAGGEDTELHAYGASLVREALAGLMQLASGEIVITGATPAENLGSTDKGSLPTVSNGDPYSQVDGFYEVLTPGAVSVVPAGIPYAVPPYYPRGH